MNHRYFAQKQLKTVETRLNQACTQANRNAQEICLIGAAKQQTVTLLDAFIDAGLANIGENYLNEAQIKMQELTRQPTAWHFIGAIQSNKTSAIAQHFDWVHSVDRLKIARRLSEARRNTPLNILIQINLHDESSKSGVSTEQTGALCAAVNELPMLNLRGLMVIPKPTSDIQHQRDNFRRTFDLLQQINARHSLAMDQLSMGMSGDLEAAILEGSTMIRIGTDLFGSRSAHPALQ